MEYKNYNNIFKAFLNRLYGDYYKFYKYAYYNVINQIDGFSIKFNSNFPSYKDLEMKEYSFTDTIAIHSELIKIVNELQSYLITLKHENRTDEVYSSYGINIDNLVTVNNYRNVVLSEKINLIVNCLKSYSTFQSRFLERFALKLKFIYAQTLADIRLEDNEVLEKNVDKDILTGLESPSKKEIVKILNRNKTPSITSDSDNESISLSDSSEEILANTQEPKRVNSISFKKILVTTLCFMMICSASHPNDTQFSTELVVYKF